MHFFETPLNPEKHGISVYLVKKGELPALSTMYL